MNADDPQDEGTEEGVLGRIVQHSIDEVQFFTAPEQVTKVTAVCSEVSALCPVTHQPDLYTVKVQYSPNGKIIESKSLKLFMWRYRNVGISCEDLAADIADRLASQHGNTMMYVTATQQSRGGIVLTAEAYKVVPWLDPYDPAFGDS